MKTADLENYLIIFLEQMKKIKIKMTAPVTQIKKNGNTYMQFYLPSKFNSESVPNPSNANVKISKMD